jgi:transcriptional regulator with PAS, ATPase and Fis domain
MQQADYPLIGTSVAIRRVREDIGYASRADAKVLITGESGVGKEIVCREIHAHGKRSRGPLVAVNCGCIAESLLESELFGHVRGSFTGAHRNTLGKIPLAARGTLFLDEVSEMGARMQALLLRFLESGEVQRVGSDTRELERVDVRVISASNRNLHECVKAQEFREDLYYRLNVIHITVPPLRERKGDIPMLVEHFLDVCTKQHGVTRPELTSEALLPLLNYDWPGNVRELRNVIERLTVRWMASPDEAMRVLYASITEAQPAEPAATPVPALTRAETMHREMVGLRGTFWDIVHKPFMEHDLTRADLKQLLEIGLRETQGNYRLLIELYNVAPTEYKRFMSFLRAHGCRVPFQNFRKAPAIGPRPRIPATP